MIPKFCSISHRGLKCRSVTSHIISIIMNSERYMIGTVCNEHFSDLREGINHLLEEGRFPRGKIEFQEARTVATACFLNSYKNSAKV